VKIVEAKNTLRISANPSMESRLKQTALE